MKTSLLIVDDEPKMSGVLARMLARDGYQVEWTDNPAEAMQLLDKRTFDIVLSDLRMPAFSGIDVLERAKAANPAVDFVMMTAYATPQTAVESMKKGAIDYLIKPFSIDDLRALIARIVKTRAEATELQDDFLPRAQPVSGTDQTAAGGLAGEKGEDLGLIAESPEMREVLARIRKVAASDASVLLRGESGTGKEVIARSLHRLSRRASSPLISINCGAIPESLMESELFGHIKGSFTGAIENRKGLFEAADTGTVFLDEIGELPLYLQVKLLRVLQEGEIQRVGESVQRKVDVRVIAATNRDLEADVARGDFRKDLYYRLNVIPVMLPPLRDRRTDILPLINHFLRRYSPAGEPVPAISPDAMQLLMEYDYPGNIRELENAIEHAVVLSDGKQITARDLPAYMQNGNMEVVATAAAARPGDSLADFTSQPAASHLEQAEIALIMQALARTNYNFTRAAQHLGITRRTLGYRINKYGLYDEILRQKNTQP